MFWRTLMCAGVKRTMNTVVGWPGAFTLTCLNTLNCLPSSIVSIRPTSPRTRRTRPMSSSASDRAIAAATVTPVRGWDMK